MMEVGDSTVARMCRKCGGKTSHARIQHDSTTYRLICSGCQRVLVKKEPHKRPVVKSAQYADGIPDIMSNLLVTFKSYGIGVYPACKKHGALLRFQDDIWRCVEDGFAVKWRR